MPLNKNSRIEIYDWIRVLGMMLVVIGHASYLSHATDFGSVAYELPSTINSHYEDFIPYAIRFIGGWAYSFHMPLFFILSGAVYALKKADTFDGMVIKKAKSLIVPYYIYGVAFMLPVKVISDFYKNADMKKVFRNFFEGGAENGHLWFLITLFWCFLLGYLLIEFVGKKSMIAALLIALILSKCELSFLPAFMGFSNAFNYVFWFMLGFVFEKYLRKKIEEQGTGKTAMIFALMTAVMIILPVDNGQGATAYVAFYCAWFILLALLSQILIGRIELLRKLILFLSPLCVYIYIFHDPMEYFILKEAFEHDWLSSGVYVYVYYFIRTAGVFIVSALLGFGICKIKGKIKRRNSATVTFE